MSWLPALLGGAASFIGGERANAARQKQSREAMAFSERMRDTQFQASARDLEKAGLNRILALGSPSAAPQGQQAQIQDTISPAITTALESSKTLVGNELTRAKEEITNIEKLLKSTTLPQAKSKEIIAKQILDALEAGEGLINSKKSGVKDTLSKLMQANSKLIAFAIKNHPALLKQIEINIKKKYSNDKTKMKRVLKSFYSIIKSKLAKTGNKSTKLVRQGDQP